MKLWLTMSGAASFSVQGSPFAGSYVGSYSGTVNDSSVIYSVSGGVNYVVDVNGIITVTNPGSGSGTVTLGGASTFSAKGSGAYAGIIYHYVGTFIVSGGTASASGTWTVTFSGGSASGTWSATR